MSQTKLLNYLDTIFRNLFIFGLPLILVFFLPTTQDYYETNKWFLLALITLLAIAIWSIKSILTNKIQFNLSKALLSWLALSFVALLSLIFASSNKVEAALSPLGVITYFCVAIITLFAFEDAKNRNKLKWSFLSFNTLLATIAIYQYFGISKIIWPNANFFTNQIWTPVGSSLTLVAILLISLPLTLEELITGLRKKNTVKATIAGVFTIITCVGIGLTLTKLIPLLPNSSLPLLTGWGITLESLKKPLQAMFGFGVENFTVAQTLGRPISYNLTPVWNLVFNTNLNVIFHTVTTLGILGLLATITLIFALWPGKKLSGINVSLGLCLISLFVIPPSLTLIVALAIILMIKEDAKPKVVNFPRFLSPLFPIPVLALILAILIGMSGYGLTRHYLAEYNFYQSLLSANRNEGNATYLLQNSAIKLNPFKSRFHATLSQTNLALAGSVSNRMASESGQTKENDRKLLIDLLQQAVNEAKIAAVLAPDNPFVWQALAETYTQMIGLADDSGKFAVAAFQKAVSLNPTDPMLRLSFGNMYAKNKDWNSALAQYTTAVQLKPNYPNGFYNLGVVYREQKSWYNAAVAFRRTLELLSSEDPDRARVAKELEQAKAQLKPKELEMFEGKPATPSPTPTLYPAEL